jgi:4-hydroxybenzoate polyprenyltransferase/phosphoserine phosphatase
MTAVSSASPANDPSRDDGVSAVPLVIDLDGTLLRTDSLHESALLLLRAGPHHALSLPVWLTRGKARMKHEIAQRVELDVAGMPYHDELVAWIGAERKRGRHVVLATAADEKVAHAVSAHLGLFDEVIASDGAVNRSAHRKAALLVEKFGERGFDYAGNSRDDLPVWERARRAIVVSAPAEVRRAAAERAEVEREFAGQRSGLRAWIKALRLHQWMKNLLLFLPLLGAHQIFDPALLTKAIVAFFAFGFCASSVYVVNDLMDLESDRHHPRKRLRPFAAGVLSPLTGVAVAAVLALLSLAIAWWVAPAFLAWLLVYFVITVAYTFALKRKEIVDALSLAALYTLRIIAGGAAVGLAASFWLLAFSLFLFLSLAFVKRYSELQVMLEQGRDEAKGRGYRTDDLPLIQTLGVVAGFAAVLVLALYINGETVVTLYQRPEVMWLTVPILLYWITRIWIKTHRGLMHDDPVLFALKDRVSILSGAMFLAVMWAAT